jgi:hypothetical protein
LPSLSGRPGQKELELQPELELELEPELEPEEGQG